MLPPRLDSLGHLEAVFLGREEVTSGTEVAGHRPIGCQEALGVAGGLQPPHVPSLLARRLVGVFRTVIEVTVLPVFHAG